MSISSIINRNNYIGNDSTNVYPYSFKVYTKNDFEIKVRDSLSGLETLLVVDVDYTVSGAGTVSGGNITLIGAGDWLVAGNLTSGYELSIRRLREIKQLADIKNQGSFFPEVHEDVFDKLVMIDLQQQDSIDRSVKLPSSINPSTFNASVPASIVGAASRAFITNPTGDGFDVGPTADEISGAQASAIAADASAMASSLSAIDAANSAAAVAVEVATHAALTSTHGVSGNIVGTSGVQTLSDKTLTTPVISQILNTGTLTLPTSTDTLVGRATVDVLTNKDIDGGTASNTRRITLPKDTKSNLDLLDRKAGTLVYDTTTNKPYYDDGANLKVIGSGSGGSVNFITDGDAESSNPFLVYKGPAASAPTTGSGIIPPPSFVSIATSSTDPLAGDKSFVITKIFGNAIGEGVSVPFSVQPAYKARMLKISFDYFASTGFEPPYSTFNSDITVWIYDITASKLIQPSNIQILSRDINGTFQAEFQSDSASTDYRLILHCGTVNTAAWTFKADNFSVSPSQYVYAAPITDDISYTPTVVNGTNVNLVKATWSRRGDKAFIRMYYGVGGTGAGGLITFSLPPGLVMDTTKFNALSVTKLGNGQWQDSGTAQKGLLVNYNSNTTVSMVDQVSNGGLVGGALAINDTLSFDFEVPISGWTSSTQVSDGYDARDLTFSGTQVTQAVTASVTNIAFTTTKDSAASWNGTQYIVKSAGDYLVSGSAVLSAAGTTLQVYKNGTFYAYFSTTPSVSSASAGSLLLTGCVAGDLISLRATASITVTNGVLSITKNQAPTTISRGATIAHRASTTATTAYANTTVSVFAPGTLDAAVTTGAGGTYNPATGEFTANTQFTLDVCYSVLFGSASWTANTRINMDLFKNGVSTGQANVSPYAQTTTSFVMGDKGYFTTEVKSGDVIKLMLDQNSGSSKSLIGQSNYNWIVFKRAGG